MEPVASPGGYQDFFKSLVSAGKRELNKARATFWQKAAAVTDRVDKVFEPVVKTRNAVVSNVGGVAKGVKAIVNPLNIRLVLIVIVLAAAGWLLLQYRRTVK